MATFDDPQDWQEWASKQVRNNQEIDAIWVQGARPPLLVARGFPAATQAIGLAIKPSGRPENGTVVGRVRVRMDASVNGAPFTKEFDLTAGKAVVIDGRGLARLNVSVLASNLAFASEPTNPLRYLLRVSPTPFPPDDSGVDRHAWLYETYPSTSTDYQVPQDADGFVVPTDDPGFTFRHYNTADPAALVDFPWPLTRGDIMSVAGAFFRVSVPNQIIAWRIRL